MTSVNKVLLVGRLGKDPEMRFGQSGNPLCTFSLATTKKWRDKDSNNQERTNWHKVIVWGKQAESCGQYLHKGSLAYVEGEIETRKYQDAQGQDRYVTEIKAQGVRFLDSKQSQERQQQQQQAPDDLGYGDAQGYADRDADVPF